MPFRKSCRTAIPPRGKPSAGHGHETPRAPGVSRRPDHGSAPRLRNSPHRGSIPRKRSTAVFGLTKSPALREYWRIGISELPKRTISPSVSTPSPFAARSETAAGRDNVAKATGTATKSAAALPHTRKKDSVQPGARFPANALPYAGKGPRRAQRQTDASLPRPQYAGKGLRFPSEPSSPYVALHARERPLLLARPSGKVSRRSPYARKGPPPEPSFRPFTAKPPSMEYGYAPLSRYASMTARKASP